MTRLLWADTKETVTQIPLLLIRTTTNHTLKQMAYIRRRPHQVLSMSAKNRKLRVQLSQAHQKLDYIRVEKCSLVWWVLISTPTVRSLWLVGSDFGITNMKAWIHPAFYQQLRVVVMEWCREHFFWCTLNAFHTNWALFKHQILYIVHLLMASYVRRWTQSSDHLKVAS